MAQPPPAHEKSGIPRNPGRRDLGMTATLLFPSREIVDRFYVPLIYTACRTCYSELEPAEIFRRAEAGEIDRAKMQKLISGVIESGHGSTIEHVVFTFGISGVSRTLSHQLVRHRAGVAFDQQSQRYVKFTRRRHDAAGHARRGGSGPSRALRGAGRRRAGAVRRPRGGGIPGEDARFVFPNATRTNLVMTANLRALIHMSGLRLCTMAQWEIRRLFQLIRHEVFAVSPFLGSFLAPKCVPLGLLRRDGQPGRALPDPPAPGLRAGRLGREGEDGPGGRPRPARARRLTRPAWTPDPAWRFTFGSTASRRGHRSTRSAPGWRRSCTWRRARLPSSTARA